MTEWSVVLVIIALVGLGAAIIKPIVSLTKSITTLTCAVESLQRDVNALTDRNTESHDHIWESVKSLVATTGDHEKRIIRIEGKRYDGN